MKLLKLLRSLRNVRWVVFDVDGTLIDTSKSYDLAVKLTVEYVLRCKGINKSISLSEIKEMRNFKAFADDFEVCKEIIAQCISKQNIDVNLIKRIFNTFYLGKLYEGRVFNFPGLWKREKPLISKELLEHLRKKFKLGIVTGRSQFEMKLAERILNFNKFDEVVTREIARKPNPKALRIIVGDEKCVYIGDSFADELLVKNYNKKYGGGAILLKADSLLSNVRLR